MGRVKSQRARTGTRNHAFFPQLSGLARRLDKVIEDNSIKPAPSSINVHGQKLDAAEAKRQRKMERNKALLEKQNGPK